MNRHLNNERQECKIGHVKERVVAGGEGEMWLRYFLHIYEYGTLKPVKII
jgi:hypothetical protein